MLIGSLLKYNLISMKLRRSFAHSWPKSTWMLINLKSLITTTESNQVEWLMRLNCTLTNFTIFSCSLLCLLILLARKKRNNATADRENIRFEHSDTVVDEFFPVFRSRISIYLSFSAFLLSVFHIVYQLRSNILRHNYHVNLDSAYAINVDSDQQQNILRVAINYQWSFLNFFHCCCLHWSSLRLLLRLLLINEMELIWYFGHVFAVD